MSEYLSHALIGYGSLQRVQALFIPKTSASSPRPKIAQHHSPPPQQWPIDSIPPTPLKMAQFLPRTSFPAQLSLPRSYFLGHHASGLSKMKTMLSSIDLILECRDYRVPLTSRNPLFEESLAGRQRMVIYTKRDLGSKDFMEDKRVCFPPPIRWKERGQKDGTGEEKRRGASMDIC